MNRLLIRQVSLKNQLVDILVEGNRIACIAPQLDVPFDTLIDGQGKAAIPGLINGHCHASMTLFRGFADDMPLFEWLSKKIWPNEANLTEEDIYWGTKLACLEMIKTGTTYYFDMYFQPEVSARVIEEMGLRANLSPVFFDGMGDFSEAVMGKVNARASSRVQVSLGPHAIYTVSGRNLKEMARCAEANDLLIHLHLAETQQEVNDSLRDHGTTPVRYLKQLGLLSPRLVAAHVLYVDDEEISMLADHGVKVIHNPLSNLKLASGTQFRSEEMRERGVLVGLGTDGVASNNNLDMFETMKFAALNAKGWRKDPTVMPAEEAFDMATINGAKIFDLDAGEIVAGRLADIVLVDLMRPAFTPNFHFISNLVYAANGSCVDTVIVDGRVLMQGGKVDGEQEILARATESAYRNHPK